MKHLIAVIVVIFFACENPVDPLDTRPLILEIDSILTIPIQYGQQPFLPREINAYLSDSTVNTFPVIWVGKYDPFIPGEYTLCSRLILNNRVQNQQKKALIIKLVNLEGDSLKTENGYIIPLMCGSYDDSGKHLNKDAIDRYAMTYYEKTINALEYSYRVITDHQDAIEAKNFFSNRSDSVPLSGNSFKRTSKG
jgi:hypothetical protein